MARGTRYPVGARRARTTAWSFLPVIFPKARYPNGVVTNKNEGKLHPVAFHSRKLSSAEINYDVHDKELLAIVDSFTRWRHYLQGAKHEVKVLSDHQNLAYFMTAKSLNRRQAR